MKEIKIQEEVIKRIDAKGWRTASDFYWSLAAGAEEAFKIILEAAKVDKGGLPTVLQTIDAGKLRRLLDECKKVCVSDKGSGKAAQSNDATAPAGRSNLLGIDLGPRLTADVLQRLWTEFEDNYPAEVVTGDLRPCRPLLQTIFSQKAQKEIRFIPWKNIMSEAQADRAKTFSSRKEKAFIDILAAAAGQADVPEMEPTPSPYVVQKILTLRCTSWALVGWCHLGAAKRLVVKFMELYTAPGLAALNMRGPSIAEAAAADGEICRELNRLMCSGFSLDQAIHELVEVRNALSVWLQARPRIPWELAKGTGKRNGKREQPYTRPGKGKGAKYGEGKGAGKCHAFQRGKCERGDQCRFEHACEFCGSADHGRSACPKLAEKAP